MSGAFFETFVVGEILKSYYNAGILEPPMYYYRDKDKHINAASIGVIGISDEKVIVELEKEWGKPVNK